MLTTAPPKDTTEAPTQTPRQEKRKAPHSQKQKPPVNWDTVDIADHLRHVRRKEANSPTSQLALQAKLRELPPQLLLHLTQEEREAADIHIVWESSDPNWVGRPAAVQEYSNLRSALLSVPVNVVSQDPKRVRPLILAVPKYLPVGLINEFLDIVLQIGDPSIYLFRPGNARSIPFENAIGESSMDDTQVTRRGTIVKDVFIWK